MDRAHLVKVFHDGDPCHVETLESLAGIVWIDSKYSYVM